MMNTNDLRTKLLSIEARIHEKQDGEREAVLNQLKIWIELKGIEAMLETGRREKIKTRKG